MSLAPDGPTGRAAAWRWWLVVLAVAAAACAVLALHARRYLPFFVDDGFISLRYSERLLGGKGLTWTDGERVEGYSDLLWVLACAALGRLGLDLVVAARVVGFSSACATIAAVVVALRPRSGREVLAPLAAGLALALSGALAAWSIGGLEAPLLAALLGWSLVGALRLLDPGPHPAARVLAPGAALALACLTRPDAALLAATTIALVALLTRRRPGALATTLRLALLPAIAVSGQLAFRRGYYGEWVPNTALVKVAGSWSYLLEGVDTLVQSLMTWAPLWLAAPGALAIAVVEPARRARVLLLAGLLAAWVAYCTAVGGDSQAYRSLVPALVMLALLAGELLRWTASRPPRTRLAAWALAIVGLVLHGRAQPDDPNDRQASSPIASTHTWRLRAVAETLRRAFASEQPLLAVDSAGVLPYFTRFPSLDMLGLCDSWLAHHPPPGFGRGMIGHELGDGDYVLRRAPPLIVFGTAFFDAPAYRGGTQLAHDPRFAAQYRRVAIEAPEPPPHPAGPPAGTPRLFPALFYAWIRVESPIGIARRPDAIVIPGHLLASTTVARTAPDGRLEAIASQAHPAGLRDVELPAGSFRIEVDGADADVSLVDAATAAPIDIHERAFTLPRLTLVTLSVTPRAPGVVRLRAVTFAPLASP